MATITINKRFKDALPELTAEEFDKLEASILAEGVRDPIVLWNNQIVDGHNRYQIATKHGLKYKTIERDFDDADEVIVWMLTNQLGRRNMEPAQRVMVALQHKPAIERKAKEQQGKRTDICQNSDKSKIPPIDTKKEVAKLAGVSHDTVHKVETVVKSGNDELIEKMRTGSISVNKAASEVKKEIRLERESEKRDAHVSHLDIRRGDFKKVLADVHNIDAIITDPPYPKEFIECFSDLAIYAKEHVKEDGFVVVYSGQYNLPDVIHRMSEHLTYVWTFCLYHEGKKQLVNGVNIMCGWKPVLVFSNGKKKMRFSAYDVVVSEQTEKHSHEWQQSESGVRSLIEIFTEPGDLVVDPFSGSGTFCKVADEMNRKAIGAEIK